MKAETEFSDEAKLTAYALGELDGEERTAVEARLRGEPTAEAAVAEIRATAARIEAALAGEPVMAEAKRTSDRAKAKAAIVAGGDSRKLDGGGLRGQQTRVPRLLRRESFYYIVGGLAAACLALVIVTERGEIRQRAGGKPMARQEVAAPIQLMEMPKVNALAEADELEPTFAASAPATVSLPLSAPPMPPGVLADIKKGVIGGIAADAYDATGREKNAAERSRYAAEMRLMTEAKARAHVFPGQASTRQPRDAFDTEAYAFRAENGFLGAAENPLSTFSADVDTASYANMRRFIESRQRPPVDAVRIEELVNYFPYRYPAPKAERRDEGIAAPRAVQDKPSAAPFAASLEAAEAPWATGHRLVRIGLKGREIAVAERGAANLVFLLDVSGSMNEPNKLPLVKASMRLLLARLRPDDRVAIVTYAGASGLALPSTPAAKAHEIAGALDELQPGGSTNGAMGIQLAYDIAKANFVSGGINRVVLCTDGDFNVGVTSEGELVRLIQEKAKTGVFLTVLGFGMGNYKDATLQQLADAGNGNYGYIDTQREAAKLLVEQVSGTLVTIAKDVKLQVEFNPAQVASYRLIGYEKRMLKKEDFNNDKIDAGEIGSGHTVTALYEIVPVGTADAGDAAAAGAVDPLKYAAPANAKASSSESGTAVSNELLTLKVRYKEPAGEVSQKLEFPLVDGGARFEAASEDFKFAAAVAAFGMILRESPYKGTATINDVIAWAESGISTDAGGYRAEFVELAKRARALQ